MTRKIFNEEVKSIEDFQDFDYTPLNNQVILYVPPMFSRTKGGIIIPDTSMKNAINDYFKKTKFHLVVAASKKAIEQYDVKPGDYVSLNKLTFLGTSFFNTPKYQKDNFAHCMAMDVDGKLTDSSIETIPDEVEVQVEASVESSNNS